MYDLTNIDRPFKMVPVKRRAVMATVTPCLAFHYGVFVLSFSNIYMRACLCFATGCGLWYVGARKLYYFYTLFLFEVLSSVPYVVFPVISLLSAWVMNFGFFFTAGLIVVTLVVNSLYVAPAFFAAYHRIPVRDIEANIAFGGPRFGESDLKHIV